MKFCERHWESLREAITERGLYGFVPDSGDQAIKQALDTVEEGKFTVDNFDPLMGAHNIIVANALDLLGLALLSPDQDGNLRCPLCFLTEVHGDRCEDPDCKIEDFDDWVDLAADDMLEVAEKL